MSFRAANHTSERQFIEVPLMMYPGYQAVDSAGNELDVTYGADKVVSVLVPPWFNDEIRIRFAGKIYWKAAAIISFVTVLLLVFRSIRCRSAGRMK